MTNHTCNGKATPTCKSCWADVDATNEQPPAVETVVINAPNNQGVVAKTSKGQVWHL
jgi:hypothetical protein